MQLGRQEECFARDAALGDGEADEIFAVPLARLRAVNGAIASLERPPHGVRRAVAERRRAESDPGHASAAVEGDEGRLRGGTLREDRLRCAPAEPASLARLDRLARPAALPAVEEHVVRVRLALARIDPVLAVRGDVLAGVLRMDYGVLRMDGRRGLLESHALAQLVRPRIVRRGFDGGVGPPARHAVAHNLGAQRRERVHRPVVAVHEHENERDHRRAAEPRPPTPLIRVSRLRMHRSEQRRAPVVHRPLNRRSSATGEK